MNNGTLLMVGLIIVIIALGLGLAIGYLYKQSRVEKAKREQLDDAERILEAAKEEARLVEIKSRDQALEVLKKAEFDNERKRNELGKEEDRLQKRRRNWTTGWTASKSVNS